MVEHDPILNEKQCVEFIIAPEENYECVQCGQCCSDFWEIPIDPESADRIQELDISQIRPSLRYYEPFKKSPLDPERTIIKQVDGRCCFLIKQRLCGLHYHFGSVSKPRVCRQFPYIYVHTPDGIVVTSSFACPQVQKNEGLSLIEQLDDIRNTYSIAFKTTTIPSEINLNDSVVLQWEQYSKVEQGLLELLSIETMPVTTLLIAGNVYIDLLSDFIHEAERDEKYSRDEIIDTYLKIMREQHFGRPLSIAQHLQGTPSLQRLYIGLLISFRNTLTRKRSYPGTILFWLRQYFLNVIGLGKFQILPVDQRIDATDFSKVRFPLEDPFFRYTILRYTKMMIFRKQGLDKMSFQKSYRFIMLYISLIRWYATALAVSADSSEIDRSTFLRAIGLVEQYYVRHTAMDSFFTAYPQLDMLLERFMNNKQYAAIMALPPTNA